MTTQAPQSPEETQKQVDAAIFDTLNLSRDDSDSETSYFQTRLSPTENGDENLGDNLQLVPTDESAFVARTPPRILSSNTLLYGENLVTSTRLSGNSYLAPRLSFDESGNDEGELYEDDQAAEPDLLFSPSLQSAQASEATTPPSTVHAPTLSPPLLTSSEHGRWRGES